MPILACQRTTQARLRSHQVVFTDLIARSLILNGGSNPEHDTIAMDTDYFHDLQGDLGIPWDYHISSSEGEEEDSSSSKEEEESSDGQDSDEESVTNEVGEDNLVTP